LTPNTAGIPGPGRPIDAPTIDLTATGSWSQFTIAPEILDTQALPVAIQITGPSTADGELLKKYLPPHSRDKTLGPGPQEHFPVGSVMNSARTKAGPSFPGIAFTGWRPPDPTLAVGPDHVVSTVNMAIAFHTKDGTLQYSAELGSGGNPGFFEGEGAGGFTFDPKCFYDHLAQRFVVVVLEYYNSTDEAYIDIAVSDDSDPNGVWYKYRTWAVVTVGSTEYWVDYPGFGYNETGYFVTGNLFRLNGSGPGFGGVIFRSFQKSEMLDGGAVTVTDTRDSQAASVQVAQHFDDDGPFFMSLGSHSSLTTYRLDNPFDAPTIVEADVAVEGYQLAPPDAPHPGGTLSTGDGRLMNIVLRDGVLHSSHAVKINNRSAVRWYALDASQWPPVSTQTGEIQLDAPSHTFYPAVSVNRLGDIAVAFGACHESEFASIQIAGRRSSDPPGMIGAPVELIQGDANADGRWGDYFDIAVDPVDDTTFWMIGQIPRDFGWETHIQSFSISCPSDVTGDSMVGVNDLLEVISEYGQESDTDVTGDGWVDIADILQIINDWGPCPGG
jgi:hypothetical protein